MSFETRCPSCARVNLVDAAQSQHALLCPECGTRYRHQSATATGGGSATRSVSGSRASAAIPMPGVIGRFQIRGRLGAGAFGTVYRAYDPQLDREVALKVPNAAALDSPRRVERFLREAKAAAQLRHPNIVPVFDAGKDGDTYYIASAFINGKPLADAVEERGMDFRQAADLARQLAEALAYAHGQGVVHRDVKPANILLDAHGHVQLADFGLAARQEEARLTNDGALLGTPSYMAPEAAGGQKGEARPESDQYAAGVVLYELLTGQTPFDGPPEMVLYHAIHTEPVSPRKHRPYLPKDLETICLKAMAKRPEARYADCQALADDLRRWLEGQPIAARRVGPAERLVRWVRKNPAVTACLALTVASLVVVGVLAIRAADRAREAESARAKADETAKANEKLLRESLGLKDEVQLSRTQAASLTSGRQAEVERLKKQVADLDAKLFTTDEYSKAGDKARKEAEEATKAARGTKQGVPATDRLQQQLAAMALQRSAVYGQVLHRLNANSNLSVDRLALLFGVPKGLRKWEWEYLMGAAEGSTSGNGIRVLRKDKYPVFRITPTGNAIVGLTKNCSSVDVWHLGGKNPFPSWSNDTRISDSENELFLPMGDGMRGLLIRKNDVAYAENHVCLYTFGEGFPHTVLSLEAGDRRKSWATSPNGEYFAITTDKSDKLTYGSFTGTNWEKAPINGKIRAISNDGKFGATDTHLLSLGATGGGPDGLSVELKGDGPPPTAYAFSALTSFLAYARTDPTGSTAVLAMHPGKPSAGAIAFRGHRGTILAITFDADESRMATAGDDGTVKVWDTDTRECLLTLTAPGKTVTQLAFSADGLRLVALTDDFRYRVWSATEPEPAATPDFTPLPKKAPSTPKPTLAKGKVDATRLAGKWFSRPSDGASATLYFADDGKMSGTFKAGSVDIGIDGTYTLTEANLALSLRTGNAAISLTVWKLSATELVLETENGLVVTFSRIK